MSKAPNLFPTGVYSSKYRHLEGVVGPRDSHVENIRNLSHTVPGESNMFAANEDRFAVPLSGAGGLVAVIEVRAHDSAAF